MGSVPALCSHRGPIRTHRRWRELDSRPLRRRLGRLWWQHAGALCAGRQQQQPGTREGRVRWQEQQLCVCCAARVSGDAVSLLQGVHHRLFLDVDPHAAAAAAAVSTVSMPPAAAHVCVHVVCVYVVPPHEPAAS